VSKLTAGSIAVGQYIQSTGYSSGSSGWRISGNGSGEVNNWVVRGTIYASAGLIDGVIIDDGTVTAAKMNVTSLSAINANAGTLSINTTGYLRSGAVTWTSGTGFWLGYHSGEYKFRIGGTTGPRLMWDGEDLTIIGADFDDFSASIPLGGISGSTANGSRSWGSRSVTVTGGKAPYTYSWILRNWSSSNDDDALVILSGGGTTTVGINTKGTNTSLFATIQCTVNDANGRSCITTFGVSVIHGSPP
jgi:hypothetical protein